MNKNITSTIKYIGVDDLTIKLFENQYIVPNGMSYNSYLIEDEKIAIMDTADARMTNEWKRARLSSVSPYGTGSRSTYRRSS